MRGAGLRLRREARIAELARDVWRDRELADRLEREAEELAKRFDEAFWVEERGGYYALALDGEKRQVDSLCSNIGHLLWSGIVPPERVDAVVDALMGDALWSGWGVRTMSSGDAGFNPLSYHNGTVWPHDNSLIAWGLARDGRWQEAHRIVRRMLDAAGTSTSSCPRSSPASPRAETPFPIAYPTAARPQAWAAGTPVLLLQLLLGLEPDRERHQLETRSPPELPSWAGDAPADGVRAFDRLWDVASSTDRAGEEAERPLRIASRPVWFPVPPTGYGGIEWVVSLLAEGLVEPATTSRSSRRATRARRRSSKYVFEQAPSEQIGRTFPELQHALDCYRAQDEFDVDQRPLRPAGAAIGGAVETPVVAHGARPARRRVRARSTSRSRGRAAASG